MKPRHQVSRAAIELIKRFEGYRRKAAQLPDGRWTIGYGHTLTARQGAEVSEADAEALLLYDLIGVAHTVGESVFAQLTQCQFDALCAFAFNVGLDAFRRSDVLKRVNEGDHVRAAFAMELWRKAEFEGEPIVVEALIRRRAAEKLLYLTPQGAWTPAPSAVLTPQLDLDGFDATPRQTPTPVTAAMGGERVLIVREDAAATSAEPEPEAENPVRAAAEEVTARLQTIFPETWEDRAEAENEAEFPGPVAPSNGLEELEEANVASQMPPAAPEETAAVETPPTPADAEDAAPEDVERELPFDADAAPANDLGPAPAPGAAPPEPARERVVIDDIAPYEFVPTPVQPIRGKREGGGFSLVLLALLGLAFFSGGVFWALNAQRGVADGAVDPLLVGWMAGIAGVICIAVAVYLGLQRLGRAAERRSDHPRI